MGRRSSPWALPDPESAVGFGLWAKPDPLRAPRGVGGCGTRFAGCAGEFSVVLVAKLRQSSPTPPTPLVVLGSLRQGPARPRATSSASLAGGPHANSGAIQRQNSGTALIEG